MPHHQSRHLFRHDFAFFDPAKFESLRKLVLMTEDDLEAMDLRFEIDLSEHEGGGVLELVTGGASIAVTSRNVLDYVQVRDCWV